MNNIPASSTPQTAPRAGRDLPYLRAWRERAGLSQADLGARAYVHENTISRIERGALTPTLEIAQRIADALGIEPWHLIERPPSADEFVVASTRVVFVERRRRAADGGGSELWFYVPTLWSPLWHSVRRLPDETARQARRAELAAAAGLSVDELAAAECGAEPLTYLEVQALARALGCTIGALVDWGGRHPVALNALEALDDRETRTAYARRIE